MSQQDFSESLLKKWNEVGIGYRYPRWNPEVDRLIVFAKTDGYCYHCGVGLDSWTGFAVDHFYPRSLGGSDDYENLVPSCINCNTLKGVKILGPKR